MRCEGGVSRVTAALGEKDVSRNALRSQKLDEEHSASLCDLDFQILNAPAIHRPCVEECQNYFHLQQFYHLQCV
jgi:hypothetical protein